MIAGVGCSDGDVIRADLSCGRRPVNHRVTVDRRCIDRRARPQSSDGIAQRILIEIAHAHRDAHALPGERNRVAEVIDRGRLVRAVH